ncbi:MAG: WD40 repeat domain-containing protein [Hydrogenimonas sp.]|nr:WD40 repeat domain-containing protein [Hydrogenimonas sp.]
MNRFAISLICIFSLAISSEILPSAKFFASGIVTDFVVENGRLYVGTDRGTVDIFDIDRNKMLYQVALEPIEDGRGGAIPPKVLSVDVRDGELLIVSIGKEGFRRVWLYRDFTLQKVADENRKLFIKEARFSDNGHIVVGTFGSQLALYGVDESYEIYRRSASSSSLGALALDYSGGKLFFGDEAGDIYIFDIKSGREVEKLSAGHLDKVHSLAYAKGVVVSGGHDRRVGVHFLGATHYYIKTGFPVFCVGISPNGNRALFSSGDRQILQLFDVKTGKFVGRLAGHQALVNKILFLSEERVISSERSRMLLLWSLPAPDSQ